MRVSLFYNEGAGDGISLERIVRALHRQRHQLVCIVEKDPEALIRGPSDLVVAAGGDGTVSAAARALAGRGVPLAILPLGTANNIARCLGTDGSIEQVIESWRTARRRPFDLGTVHGAWGREWFVE